MPDKLYKKKQDTREISLDEAYEIRQWVRELDCTEPQLRAAVKAAGHSATAVKEYLETHK